MNLSTWIEINKRKQSRDLLLFGIAWLAITPLLSLAFVIASTL